MPETVPAAIDKDQDLSREQDAYVILRLPFSAYRPAAGSCRKVTGWDRLPSIENKETASASCSK
jgi:hypothetical protein